MMNSYIGVNNATIDLFHYLTGEFRIDKDNKYYFSLSGVDDYFYVTDESTFIVDPAIDSSFKYLFGNNAPRLENFLNQIYFLPRNEKLEDLQYLVGDYYELGKKYDLNSLKSDIACKGKLKNEKEILIDIEMQIGWFSDLDDRLFDYGFSLRQANTNLELAKAKEKTKKNKNKKIKRLYNNVIVIGLILDEKTGQNTNVIGLCKKNDVTNGISPLDMMNILEINVSEKLNELSKNGFVNLFGQQLSKDGADWLKFIGLRFWATVQEGHLSRYIFPTIKSNEKYSSNSYINEAILDSLEGGYLASNLFSQIEEKFVENYEKGKQEGFKEGEKINLLFNLFGFFKKKLYDNAKTLPLNYKYKKIEIFDKLGNWGISEKEILDFIKYLESLSVISFE